jgi:hypothetical protein
MNGVEDSSVLSWNTRIQLARWRGYRKIRNWLLLSSQNLYVRCEVKFSFFWEDNCLKISFFIWAKLLIWVTTHELLRFFVMSVWRPDDWQCPKCVTVSCLKKKLLSIFLEISIPWNLNSLKSQFLEISISLTFNYINNQFIYSICDV